jgi:hypothetical protein
MALKEGWPLVEGGGEEFSSIFLLYLGSGLIKRVVFEEEWFCNVEGLPHHIVQTYTRINIDS